MQYMRRICTSVDGIGILQYNTTKKGGIAMNYNWNLDAIYSSFEDPAFSADLALLEQTLDTFTAFTKELDSREQALTELYAWTIVVIVISVLIEKLATYAMLRQAADTRDSTVSSKLGQILSLASAGAAPEAAFKDWASKLPDLMEQVESQEALKPYRFYFEDLRASSRYLLPGMGSTSGKAGFLCM